MQAAALIVAAGRGERFGGGPPKQYQPLNGVALLRHSVLAFAHHPGIDGVMVVRQDADADAYQQAVAGLALLPPVAGGDTRQDSVRRGLEGLALDPPRHVLIHDAARPLVSGRCISAVLEALDSCPGAVAAVPEVDSLKRARDGRVADDVSRAGLWRAQTPQGFHFAAILQAHRDAPPGAFTDDVGVARAAGLDVALVAGSEDNLKVTTAEDLRRAERLSAPSTGDLRVAQGFDVHRFGPGDRVRLCGIDIPHDAGLAGHSDADVALHALTDALLGAAGAGDIGAHFPPGEARWRDADSARFVRHALDLVRRAGGAVLHVDLTIICEAPRVGPHRAAMQARVAELLELDPSRASVKATTTEGLGFTGRGEGIAAMATATVRLPPA